MVNSSGDTITVVPPHPINTILRIPILTKFDDLNESRPVENTIGYIPIYKGKLKSLNTSQTSVNDETNANNTQGTGENGQITETIEYQVKKNIDLKTFKSDNILDQLLQVAVWGLNTLEDATVEQILNIVINGEEDNNNNNNNNNDDDNDDLKFKWSQVDDLENKFVFVRLDKERIKQSSESILKLIKLDQLDLLGSKLKILIEGNTKQFITDTLGEEPDIKLLDKEDIEKKILKVLEQNKNKKKVSTDLDYVIDEGELKDIREEDLPQLKKDIKEFRLKVLENEKKKRQKEALEEIKRSRLQLRELFVKFKKESNSEFEPIDEDDDEDDEDDYEEEEDEKAENLRIAQKNTEMLKDYAERVLQVKRDERKNQELIEELNHLENYEKNLDQTVRAEHSRVEAFAKPYNRDRQLEFSRDEKDREEEKIEIEAHKESQDFLNTINIPLKVNLHQHAEEEEEIEEIEDEEPGQDQEENGDKLKISDEELDNVLEKIKPKVDSYIEEYLGVKEDELLEYVLMIIKDTKSKEALINELKETFDNDAVPIGENIWNDILSIV